MRGAGASRRGLGPARSRHLGAARRRQALRFLQGHDLGRLRPRHQERRDLRLQGAARCIGGRCATPFIAMSATRDLIASRMPSSNPMARNCSMPASCCCRRSASCRHRTRAFGAPSRPIEKHMMRDGFVLRHDPREVSEETAADRRRVPGLQSVAGRCLCAGGRYRQGASAVRPRGRRSRTISGCLAEEFDSGAGRQTGNFPQALTHIALINTAHNLSDARKAARSRRCSGRSNAVRSRTSRSRGATCRDLHLHQISAHSRSRFKINSIAPAKPSSCRWMR